MNRITLFKFDEHRQTTTNRDFIIGIKPTGWFYTSIEAQEDYLQHKVKAESRLDEIEQALNELKAKFNCTIDYVYEGDTYGIYEDYQYIKVTEGRYDFIRKI